MAGYFNDGNGVKNITDGYFYDGDVKYYKDVVTTKYWKEVTTGSKELLYACYAYSGTYFYAKNPIGSDMSMYGSPNGSKITDVSKLTFRDYFWESLTEDSATYILDIMGSINKITHTRSYADDLCIDTTVTEIVEGTPEDYTHTTTETTTVEVGADDEYDYKEYYPKKIKQIYKVINGEAKLIFNNE